MASLQFEEKEVEGSVSIFLKEMKSLVNNAEFRFCFVLFIISILLHILLWSLSLSFQETFFYYKTTICFEILLLSSFLWFSGILCRLVTSKNI